MSDIESKFIEVNLLSWNAVCQERDRMQSECAALEKKVEKLREALKKIKQTYNPQIISSAYVMKAIAQAALSDGSEKE
jgi:hypothetical protein